MRRLFFETKPTWRRVLCFAVLTAVVTAAALRIPGLNSTSIANIGVTLECWFLFALLIIINCERPIEAGAKTFVFFLVSQPLIYLIQVPFYSGGWSIFRFYPRWGVMTLLTFPGAMLAWYVKKDSLWSGLILSVATGYLALAFAEYCRSCVRDFPYGLAAGLFCAVLAAVFLFALLKNKKARLLCAGITLLAALIAFLWPLLHAPFCRWSYPLPEEHDWEISFQAGSVGEVTVSDSGLSIGASRYGTETVRLENENGETLTIRIEYSHRDGVTVTEQGG